MVFLSLEEPRIASDKSTSFTASLAAALEVASGLIIFFFLEEDDFLFSTVSASFFFFFFDFFGFSSVAAVFLIYDCIRVCELGYIMYVG